MEIHCNVTAWSGRAWGSRALAIAVWFWVMGGATVQAQPDRTRPNIVFVYADDMGIGDTSAYQELGNNPDDYQVNTPNMERLAAQGIRFTDAHSAAAVCTPSRIGLLTGRLPFRSDLKQRTIFTGTDFHGSIFTQDGHTFKTVGNLLQDVGYRTYGLGKWHLGVDTDSDSFDDSRILLEGPTHLGFNHFVGNIGNPGHTGEMFEDTTLLKFSSFDPNDLSTEPLGPGDTPASNWVLNNDDGELQQAKLTQRNLNAAKGFMDDHRTGGAYESQPFFMYYSSHANHSPYYAPDTIQTDANGTPGSIAVTGNTVSGGPIHVVTGPDNDNDGLPDPADPHYPQGAFDNAQEGWLSYYQEDQFGNQIQNPASARAKLVQENDVVLGELLDYLEATDDPRNPGGKLIENTLVIFTSDNGANLEGAGVGGLTQESNSQPTSLRGKKATIYEGGTRVPFIAAWAGEIPQGVTSDALFGQQDLYATFAELTQQELEPVHPDGEALDSESVLDAILGDATGVVRDTDLIYKRRENLIIRRGNYKLIAEESDFNKDGERVDPGGLTTNGDWQDLIVKQFYDLSTDLGEQNNLANNSSLAALIDDMFQTLVRAVGPDAEAGFTRGVFGDLNHDGVLDAGDWESLRKNFGSAAGADSLQAYRRGDLDGDGEIGFGDLATFRSLFDLHHGAGASLTLTSAPVPEPASPLLCLAAATVFGLLRRRTS